MTKGQLLELDNPLNIKQKFGVGYKLLCEPKVKGVDWIKKLKEYLLSEDNLEKYLINENQESTDKKLIF